MDNPGNGAKPPEAEQTDQPGEDEDAEATPAELQADEAETNGAGDNGVETEEPSEKVSELANTAEGCWKLLSGGERVDLSDQEWRQELARLLSKSPG